MAETYSQIQYFPLNLAGYGPENSWYGEIMFEELMTLRRKQSLGN